MIPSPPKKLTLAEVPRYIRGQYGHDVTKMTVFNWANHGKKGQKLKFVTTPDVRRQWGRKTFRVTTTTWVDEFLRTATEFV